MTNSQLSVSDWSAKGRGHKQATAPSLEGAKGSNKDEQPPTKSAPRKRGRKPASYNQSEVEDAPAKRAKSVVQTVDDLPAKPKKGCPRKQPQDITQRTPLPDRSVQNVHPAGQPTPHQTSKEVSAEREAQWQALEAKIREGEQPKLLFAQINVAEECLDDEMNVDNPQHLSVALRKCGCDDFDASDNGEHFNFTAIDEASPSEADDSEPVQQLKVSSTTLKRFDN